MTTIREALPSISADQLRLLRKIVLGKHDWLTDHNEQASARALH
jgi:hypothetical protein